MKNSLLILFFLPLLVVAQKKEITLEDIYKKGTFRSEYFAGFTAENSDSLFNTLDVKDESGKKINTESLEISSDRSNILFFSETEPIYRHSSRSTVYLYNVATKKAMILNKGKILHPTFSPDGKRIAYVFENNLYVYDIAASKTTAVTTDGKWNYIINGNCDWVYEEEFSFTRAFEWSPSGNYLAYYKFNETAVKEYNMTLFNNNYNIDYRYKYPKAGEENSKVNIYIYNVTNGKEAKAQYEEGDIYIPRIKWAGNVEQLVVFWMNRLQNNLKLLATDPTTGSSRTVYEETNKYYVEITDNWKFLKSGDFVFASEKSGFNQLYINSVDGKKSIQLTKGSYDIDEINSVDEKNELIYFTAAYPTPMDRQLFVTDFKGNNTAQLTNEKGWHRVEFNSDLTRFYDFHSTITNPQVVTLYNIITKRKKVSAAKFVVASENTGLKNTLQQYDLGSVEFLKIANAAGDSLNAWMLKPANFNPTQKYPTVVLQLWWSGLATSGKPLWRSKHVASVAGSKRIYCCKRR